MTFRRRNVGTGSSSQDFGGEERISRRSSVLEISWSACSRCSVEENIGGGWSAVERRINDILAVKSSRNVSAENVGRFVDARPPLPRPRRLMKVVHSLFGSLDWWEISVSQYSCSLVRYEECISLTKRTHNALSDEDTVTVTVKLLLLLLVFSYICSSSLSLSLESLYSIIISNFHYYFQDGRPTRYYNHSYYKPYNIYGYNRRTWQDHRHHIYRRKAIWRQERHK